jgi:hypothetical protein
MRSLFRGAARLRSPGIYAKVAAQIGCDEAAVRAVVAVEAASRGFLPSGRPKILFERHIFRRITGGKFDASDPAVSNKKPGGYLGGEREYDRLADALGLDAKAALESASWGVGQIMGLNHEPAGYPTARAMIEAFCEGEDAQIAAMGAFILHEGLAGYLRAHDWERFAAGYNGPAYRKNDYHTKLAAAHKRFRPPDWIDNPPTPASPPSRRA